MNKKIIFPVALSVLYLLLLFLTNPSVGVTWDEPTYFSCALSFSGSSSFQEAKEVLNCVPEHPHFVKTLGGLSHKLTRSFLDTTTSLRFGMFVLAAIFIFLFFMSISNLFGTFTALASTLILITMPKVFFHAHLLTLDFAVMVFVFLTAISFYHLIENGDKRWIFLFALSFSFLLINKIIGYIVVLPLALYGNYSYIKLKKEGKTIKLKPPLISLVLTLILLFVLLFGNLAALFYPFQSTQFQSNLGDGKAQHFVLLFGELVDSSSIKATLFYVPIHLFTSFNAFLVLLALLGFVLFFRKRKENNAMPFLLLTFVTFYLIFSSPFMPKYDNERNFLLLFPFLAIFGGCGAKWLAEKMRFNYSKAIVIALIAVLGFSTLYFAHPFYSSYFNFFVGGSRGVADRNLMTVTYWQPEVLQTLDFVNNLSVNSTIYFPGYPSAYLWYQKTGRMRQDITLINSGEIPFNIRITNGKIGFIDILHEYAVIINKASYFMANSPPTQRNEPPIDTIWEIWNEIPYIYEVKDRNGVPLVKIFVVR